MFVRIGSIWNWLMIVSKEGSDVAVLNLQVLLPECQFVLISLSNN
jgi:hypothetical protein